MLHLNGRQFEQAGETTIKQDAFIMARVKDLGIQKLIEGFNPTTGSINSLSQQILIGSFDSGLLFEILGGILVEPGVVWTREVALKNAEFFGNLRKKEDKDALFAEIGTILVDFLLAAVRRLNNGSPNSSEHGGEAPVSNASIEGVLNTTTVTGTASFENLQGTRFPTTQS